MSSSAIIVMQPNQVRVFTVPSYNVVVSIFQDLNFKQFFFSFVLMLYSLPVVFDESDAAARTADGKRTLVLVDLDMFMTWHEVLENIEV